MERLGAADSWFLYLEGPTVPLHVTGLLLLDPATAPRGFSFAKLRRSIEARIDLMPSLRRRLVEVPLAIDYPVWIEDPDFDLDRHLHHRVLAAGSSERDLADLVGEFSSVALPRDRPLWDMTLVEGLDAGAAALVAKLHHCIVDGVTGMDVMARLLDLSPTPKRQPHHVERPIEAVPTQIQMAANATWNRLSHPLRPVRAASDAAASLFDIARATARRQRAGSDAVAHPINAPRTRFNASITTNRSVAFGLLPLEDFKTVSRAFDVTVNDVVLATCTYGLRRHLTAWAHVPDRSLVCSVPVSIHGRGSEGAANQVSNMFVNLPVHIDNPVEQLRLIHDGSIGAKAIQNAIGADFIADVIEMIPGSIFRIATRLYSEIGLADRLAPVHNLVVSNVVGSPVPLYLAGAEVKAMYPFGPLMEGTGLNVTVLSNNGDMNIGLIACPDLVPALHELLEEIGEGLAVLLAAAAQTR